MQPGSPQVWSHRPNIFDHAVIDDGDVENGFRQADLIIENTYHTQRVEQAFLEPEGAVAFTDLDGTLVVYASTQAPHRDRMQIARALAIPERRVRVIVPRIGGAFGGKDEAHLPAEAFDFRHRHAHHTCFEQRLANLLDLEGLDDCGYEFHQALQRLARDVSSARDARSVSGRQPDSD